MLPLAKFQKMSASDKLRSMTRAIYLPVCPGNTCWKQKKDKGKETREWQAEREVVTHNWRRPFESVGLGKISL